jgi:hypothetical protein
LSALTKPVGFVVGRPSHASSIGISVISVKNQNNGCLQKISPTADVANAVERIARKDSSHHTKGAAIRSGERIAWDWMKVIDDLRV